MNGESSDPASLIIVDYQLQSLKDSSVFTSVTTSFKYSECSGAQNPAPQEKCSPNVIAYAPFERPVKFNQTTATEGHTNSSQLEIAPEVKGIKIGSLQFGHGSSSEHEQKYFERGRAGRHFEHGKATLVWWNLVHNTNQGAEITPQFRIAMLVERKSNSKFQAEFNIAARGGFGYKIQELKDKWLYKTAMDDPVIFDPTRPPMGELEGIVASELGKLKKRERLESLAFVPGLEVLESKSD
jgi:hypothetical protein